MRAVHYLRDGDLWPACGTSHDLHVSDDVVEVTCWNCKHSKRFQRALDDHSRRMRQKVERLRVLTP